MQYSWCLIVGSQMIVYNIIAVKEKKHIVLIDLDFNDSYQKCTSDLYT